MPGFHRSCISDKKGKRAKLDAFEALPASLPRTCRTHAPKPHARKRRSYAYGKRASAAVGANTTRRPAQTPNNVCAPVRKRRTGAQECRLADMGLA